MVSVSYEYEQLVDVSRIIMECLDISALDSEVIEMIDKVKMFCNFLELNRDSSELVNFHRNLRDLKVNLLFNYKDLDFSGMYDVIDNTVHINYNRLDMAIFHELLHMASRNSEGIVNCGFTKVCSHEIKYIGLNEGYTDLLSERYFSGDCTYQMERNISFLLEKIVGKNDMEKLYFQANINGLVSLLSNYSDEKDILIFLDDVDYVYNHIEDESDDAFNTKLYLTGKYLLETFYLKQKKKLEEGLLYDKFIYEVADYLRMLSRFNIMNNVASKSILFELAGDDVMEKYLILSKKM